MKEKIFSIILIFLSINIFTNCTNPAPSENLYLVSNKLLKSFDFTPYGIKKVHNYGYGSLVQINNPGDLPKKIRAQIRGFEDANQIGYRSFFEKFDSSSIPSSNYSGGIYLIALFGPIDLSIKVELEKSGLTLLGIAKPYGLVIRGQAEAIKNAINLKTTEGYCFIRQFFEIPVDARMSKTLNDWIKGTLTDVSKTNLITTEDGGVIVNIYFYKDSDINYNNNLLLNYFTPAPEEYKGSFIAHKESIIDALNNVPDIDYISPLSGGGLSLNIAVIPEVMNISPAWLMGYDGAGINILLNDTHIDKRHNDFCTTLYPSKPNECNIEYNYLCMGKLG